VQVNELLPEDVVHWRDVRSVCPERVMDRSEGYVLFLALEGCVHHVGRIERMNVVRREGRILLRLVDWLIIETFSNRERLNNCSDNVLL
jgi:hypothetical protein